MVKAVIFDVDGTLYNYDEAHAVGWEALCSYASRELGLDRDTFTKSYHEAWAIAEKRLGMPCAAVHNRMIRFQIILEEKGLPIHPHVLAMNDLYWDTLIDAAVPSPGIMECLSALKEAGYVLGVGTNMTLDYQLKKLTRLQMLHYFDFIVSSEEVLVEKPDPKLFATCAMKAGAAPAECLFIGDNYKMDVLGAAKAGMQALWFCATSEQAAARPDVDKILHYDELRRRLTG